MTYSGNQRWRRTLAIMLTAVLLLGGFTVPAQAEAWQPLAILLSWTDSAGNPASVNAWTVEGSNDQAYWARVTPEALAAGVTLNITDQTGQYAGFDVNGQLVTGIVDAGTTITDTTVPVPVNALDANGGILATFQLYISTQADMPVLPEPEPAQANVDIVCLDQATGAEIKRDSRTLTQGGDTSVQAPSIDGYTLSDPNQAVQVVTINDDGSYSPAPVTFYYTKNAAQANVDIVCLDQATGAEIKRDSRTLTQGGDTSVQAPSIDGYTLSDPNQAVQVVTINDDGSYSPAPVTFYYTKNAAQANVDIVCLDQATGAEIGRDNRTMTQGGDTSVQAPSIDGYTLSDPNQAVQVVTINDDGSYSPAPVTFYYQPVQKEPVTATVTVRYQSDDGAVNEETTLTLNPGENQPVEARSYDGYQPDAQTQYVSVSVDGVAAPSEVLFRYTKIQTAPASADVRVVYREANGAFAEEETITLNEGADQPVAARVYQGYTPDVQTQYVTVGADGTATPAEVVFTYTADQIDVPGPVMADVQVVYQTRDGVSLGGETIRCVEGEENPVPAPDFTAQGYTLADPSAAIQYVQVTADGVATPNPVTFIYAPIAAQPEPPVNPTEVTINVYYRNAAGADIAPAQKETLPTGVTTVVAPQAVMVPVEYDFASAQPMPVEVTAEGVATPAEVVFTFAEKQSEVEDIPVPQGEIINRYGEITQAQTNVRSTPEKANNSIGRLEKGERVYMIREEVNDKGEVWYRVWYKDQQAFIMGGFLQMMTKAASDQYIAQMGGNPPPIFTEDDLPGKEPEIKTAQVTVLYVTTDGETLDSQTVTVSSEQPTVITPASGKVDGYQLVSQETEITVTVDAATGEPSRSEIRFEYEHLPPAVKEAAVKVIYAAGDLVLDEQSVTVYSDKPTVITPASGKVDGYQLVSQEREITVTVDAETGAPSRSEIRFEYEPLPPAVKEAAVKVVYAAGDLVLDEQSVTVYSDKPTVITPASTKVVGYALISQETEITVTVDAETGVPSRSEIRFEYKALPPDVREADVPVVYVVGEDGRELDRQTVHVTSAQDVTVQPASAKLDGYRLISEGSVTVHVDAETGAVTPAEVRFTYEAIPTDTPVPEKYVGYALTVQNAALRTEISTAESSIITMLPQNTLVFISSQTFAEGQTWSSVNTLDEQPGMMLDSNLRHVTNEEAKYYLDQWNAAHPDQPTETAEPPVLQGYARTVGDDVQFRSMPSVMSEILGILKQNEPVYVQGQQYVDGVAWHIVRYGDRWGYIRADLLRMMTQQEAADYINSLNKPTEAPNQTPQPFNPNSLSSYGYVTSSTVNFRSGASTSASRLGTLRQYAMALVLDTQKIGSTTWYHIRYNGKDGYVSGDYFKQMTITEMNTFLTSDEYRQGVANNANNGNGNNQNNTGSSGGSFKPAEDQTVDKWTNPNNGLHVSYEPFDPFATPEPLPTGSASPSPSTSPSGSPSPSVTIELLPTLNPGDPNEGQESGGSIMGWVIAVVLLMGAGGGVYVYVLYTQNKRKAAQRAAQRRAQAAAQQRAGAQQARPGQPGAANQPRTGTYTSQGGTASPRPNAYQQPQARKPYTPGQPGSASTGSYQRPAGQPPVNGAEGGYQRPTGQRPAGTARPEGAASQGVQRPSAPKAETMTGANAQRPSGQMDTPAPGYGPEGSVSQRQGRRSYRSQSGENAYGASYRQETPAPAGEAKTDTNLRKNDDFADNGGSDDFA